MTLCLNSSGWKSKFHPKGSQSKAVKTPVCLHSCQVPEDLPGQCPLWGAPSLSYGILPAAVLHFYKAFHMNKFTNKKKAFYQTLSLIPGKGWKTQFSMMSPWVPCFRKPCSTLGNRLLLLKLSAPTPHTRPIDTRQSEPRTIDFFLDMSVVL